VVNKDVHNGKVKTVDQRITIQQYGDWYTGC